MSKKKHSCSCDNCCGRNNCCGGLGSFPNLFLGLGSGLPFNSCSNDSLLMLLLLTSLMKR